MFLGTILCTLHFRIFKFRTFVTTAMQVLKSNEISGFGLIFYSLGAIIFELSGEVPIETVFGNSY